MQITITVSSLEELKRLCYELKPDTFQGAQSPRLEIIHSPRKCKRSNKRWTQLEIDRVIDWYKTSTFTAREMAEALERKEPGVNMLIYNLKKKGVLTNRTHRASKAKTL